MHMHMPPASIRFVHHANVFVIAITDIRVRNDPQQCAASVCFSA